MKCPEDRGIVYTDNAKLKHVAHVCLMSKAYCNSFGKWKGCSKRETCLVFKELPEPTEEQISD